jgi:OmpA-OmpF porin, OOP family
MMKSYLHRWIGGLLIMSSLAFFPAYGFREMGKNKIPEKMNRAEEVFKEENRENPPEKAFLIATPQVQIQTRSKFDFIPGEKIIFYDDFSQDPVGEFPAKWNTNNSGEVVTLEGIPGKWFKLPGEGGDYYPELNLTFPENITIEFDLIFTEETELLVSFYSQEVFELAGGYVPGEAGVEVFIACGSEHRFSNYIADESRQGMEIDSESNKAPLAIGQQAHISVWIQKTRFRMYIDDQKIFDMPKGVFDGYGYNHIRLNSMYAITDVLIGSMRIAVGAQDTRNQLITEGKLVTRGILFDSDSDQIKSESYACIKEIATVLQENPEVSVTIVGHTDSDGDEAHNLDLSKRRALAVKNYLVHEFSIEASRMQTDGKGEIQPVESNATPEGKASNRRVEFIKS